MSAAVLDQHLASCINCARWVDQATRLTRQARLSRVMVPDLSDAIAEGSALPARRVGRRRRLLRVGLVVVAVAQIILGLSMMGGTHVAHEVAAWNVGLGAAFVAAAWKPRRAAGLVPLLMTFVIVLVALSVGDLADGAASAVREFAHLAVVIGMLLVLALDRVERTRPSGRSTVATPDQPADRGIRRLRGVA